MATVCGLSALIIPKQLMETIKLRAKQDDRLRAKQVDKEEGKRIYYFG